MSEVNLITLFSRLCETLIELSGAEISKNESKKLFKRALSNSFLYRSETENIDTNNAYQSLRLEIISNVYVQKNSQENVNQKLDRYLTDLETLYDGSNKKDVMISMCILLCKLSQSCPTDHDRCENLSYDGKLGLVPFSILRFNGKNFDIFNKDPFPQPLSFAYPFYEPCGTGLQFLNNSSSYLPIDNIDQIFDRKYKIWNYDDDKLVEPTLQDEGFITPGSKFSEEDKDSLYSSSCSSSSSLNSNFIVEAANIKFGKRTWEQLGSDVCDVEPPFASERAENVIHFWKIWNAGKNFREKPYEINSTRCITFDALKEDIRDLLFGLESPTFIFNSVIHLKTSKMFQISQKIHMRTLTPEIVCELCEPFMLCASHFKCLTTFVEKRLPLLFGPVHYFFCLSVRDVLNIYRYSLLRIPWHELHFLSEFEPLIGSQMRKMIFLTKFCLISLGDETDGSNFPSGVQLLDYLYDNLLKIFRTDFKFMLYHIFEKCYNSYLRIVAEWIFDGCFSNPDNYEEFFIEIQRENEICRDWRRVSCIRVKERRVPKFLQASYKKIFVCGKSVNLLKILTSKEAVEALLSINHPEIKCCFNKNQLETYIGEWKKFQIANTSNFNSQDTIRNKLLKKFGTEFYAEIKRVREEWFNRYRKSTHIISSSNPETDIVEKNEKTLDMNIVKDAQSSDEIIIKLLTEKMEDGTSDELSDSPTKTKRLVEFYENLNKDVTDTSPGKPSQIMPLNKSFIVLSSAENSPFRSTRRNSTTFVTDTAIEDTIENVVKASLSFGDYNNQTAHSSAFFHAGDGDTITSTPTVSLSIGPGGDSASHLSEYERNRRHSKVGDYQMLATVNEGTTPANKTMTELERNRLKIMSRTYQQSINEESFYSTPMNELSKNKLRVLSSEYHQRLCGTIENKPAFQGISSEELGDCTPMNELSKNKLKVLSSEYHQRLCSTIESKPVLQAKSSEELGDCSTPMSELSKNKLKVLSSEYHQRLCGTIESQPALQAKSSEELSDCSTPMSELSKNKLKVLSSEYHQRLCGTVDSKPALQAKSSEELSECERNKLNVMSSEYHCQPTNLIEEKPQAVSMKLNQRDLNRLKTMSSEYHMRLSESTITETVVDASNANASVEMQAIQNVESVVEGNENSKTTSEHFISENVQTVVEVEELENSVREEKSDHKLDTKSPERKNVFVLEDYMSKENVFPRPRLITTDSMKSIANSVNDVSQTSVLYYLSRSIFIPLKIQSRLVNEAVLRTFIEEESYLDHLLTLRNYLFLRKPQFSHMLTNTIFKMAEKVKKPYSLMNNNTLRGVLQQSLLAASSKQITTFEKKLSFVVNGTIPEAFDLTDIKMLNGISLNYSVEWPINVLITEPITKKYSRVFRFLIQIQRASWSLKNDFIRLKNLKHGRSIQYLQIQLYRYNMTQTVRILQEFIMREALETCWNELVECMTGNNISLDDLYISHLKYINKIMQRCFLCELSISCHESWLNVLSSVLKYRAALRAGSWRINTQVNFLFHTNFKEVHAVYQEFEKRLNDVRSKLKMLVYAKKRMHFEPLLIELCRNTSEKYMESI